MGGYKTSHLLHLLLNSKRQAVYHLFIYFFFLEKYLQKCQGNMI